MPGTEPIETASSKRWRHEIRRFEFNAAMNCIPLGRDSTVLELGSGDGYQFELLIQRFNRVFAIDPNHRLLGNSAFVFSVAEALPFPDNTFDLVYSCCVTEHLSDRARMVEEAARVLRPGGYMAHVVPTRLWKATGLLFNPVGYPLLALETSCALAHLPRQQRGLKWEKGPGFLKAFVWWFYPPIHGTYSSHLAEYSSYGRKRWAETFSHTQLVRLHEIPTLYYSPFGLVRFRFLSFRTWLARHGLASSIAIILRKARQAPVLTCGAR